MRKRAEVELQHAALVGLLGELHLKDVLAVAAVEHLGHLAGVALADAVLLAAAEAELVDGVLAELVGVDAVLLGLLEHEGKPLGSGAVGTADVGQKLVAGKGLLVRHVYPLR